MAEQPRVGISLLYVAPERIAGVSTYAFGIIRALLKRNAFDYVLFVPTPLVADWQRWLRGLPARFIPCGPHPDSRFYRVLYEQFRLAQLARRERVSVVFFPHTVAPRWKEPSTVVTVHDLMPLSKPTDFSWHKKIYLRWTYRSLARAVDQFVTVSDFSRRELHRKLRVPLEKIVVVANALDEEFLEPSSDLPAAINPGGPYLLSVGGAFPHKRLERVIDAFVLVSREWPELRLVMAGTFTGSAGSRKRIREHAVRSVAAERILFLPRLDRSHLAALYRNAEAFVTASEFEGFGIPVIEAIAAGCPVAATPAPGLVESLRGHGSLATDFSSEALANAIRRAMAQRTLDPSQLERAREDIRKHYSWENAAGTLEACFRAVIKRRRGSSRDHSATFPNRSTPSMSN